MKSKKLLILIIVVAAIVVTIVVLASVFMMKTVIVKCHDFTGNLVLPADGAPDEEEILSLFKGKNTIFLSKDDVVKKIQEKYPDWHVYGVTKLPPNGMEIYCMKRVAFAKLDVGGNDVYVDCFGYQVQAPTDGSERIDISSAFIFPITTTNADNGQILTFENDENNKRLSCILECLMGLWRCKVESENFATILGSQNVFTFDNSGTMTITTTANAKIHFMDPQNAMWEKFKKAFSVYHDEIDLQKSGVEITVWPNGYVTAPKYVTQI